MPYWQNKVPAPLILKPAERSRAQRLGAGNIGQCAFSTSFHTPHRVLTLNTSTGERQSTQYVRGYRGLLPGVWG